MENLSGMCDVNEDGVIKTLKNRYDIQKIYTFSADSLLALNPNEDLPFYDIHIVDQYKNKTSNAAHIFAIAENAVSKIKNDSKLENIVFTGESGSGKTTNLFHAMRYLAIRDTNSDIHIEQLNALQTILESLGSGKTLKNNVATRFGCQYELLYKNNKLSGLNLNPCIPLESSRIIWQKLGERNFSIFYQLCAELDQERKTEYGIKDAKNYFYLNQNKLPTDDHESTEKFQFFEDALTTLDFSFDQKDLLYRILSSILHLGNIFFTTQKTTTNQEFASIGNDNELKWVAHLLEVDMESVRNFLTHNSNKLLNFEQALDKRDAFAKFLYQEIFKWVLEKISQFLSCTDATKKICLFDMFGFEKYNNNGYEEFCVNLANEKLENLFVEKAIKIFQQDYENEGISPGFNLAQHIDNNKMFELLFRRPSGILPLLDDECKFPKGSDESFLQRCNLNHLNSCNYGKPRSKDRVEFGVKHYAGCVYYNVDGFRRKNYWTSPSGAYQILTSSENASIAFVFKNRVRQEIEGDKMMFVASNISKAVTAVCNELKSQPIQFIRCIRINNERTPNKFDVPSISRQIKALSIIDHLQVSQFGYVHKLIYRCLLPFEVLTHKEPALLVNDILDSQGIRFKDDYQLGSHSVFIKERLYKQLEEAKKAVITMAVLMIQRNIRKYLARKKYLAKQNAVTRIQAGFRGWKVRKIVKIDKEKTDSTSTLKSDTNKFIKKNMEVQRVGATAPVYVDTPDEVEKLLNQEKFGKTEYSRVTNYLPLKLEMEKPIVEGMSIEAFAQEHIKHHILSVRREPIFAPFLSKESEEDFSQSLKIFKLILRYMYDTTLTDEKLVILAKYIIQQGIDHPSLRDEIYVQLCNQTYKNLVDRVTVNSDRAWNLILMCVNSFPPGILAFPMLYDYFQKQKEPLSNMLMNGLLQPLRHECNRSRFYATTRLEQAALIRKQHPVVEICCSDGRKFNLEADSSSTAEEIAERVLRRRGIGDAEGWSIVIEDLRDRMYVQGHAFINDAIAQFEIPNFPEEKTSFVSFPCKKIYTHQHIHQNSQESGQMPIKTFENGSDSAKASSVRQLIENHNKKVLENHGVHSQNGNGTSTERNSRGGYIKDQSMEEHRPPSVSSNLSTSRRIRNMRIPTQDADVEKFLDNIFQQALPPVDYDTSSILAASIKGGRRNAFSTDYFGNQNGNGYNHTQQDIPTDSSTPSPPIMHSNGHGHNGNGQYYQGGSSFTPQQLLEDRENGQGQRFWYQEGNIYQENRSGMVNQQPVMMMMTPVDPRMWMHGTPSSINLTVDEGRTSQMTNTSMVQPIPVMIQPMMFASNNLNQSMNQSFEAKTPDNFRMQLKNENGDENGDYERKKVPVTDRYINVLFAPHEQPKPPIEVSSNIKKVARENRVRSKSPIPDINGRYASPIRSYQLKNQQNMAYAQPQNGTTYAQQQNGTYENAQNGAYTQTQAQTNGKKYENGYKETTQVHNREPPAFFEKLEKIYSPAIPQPKQQQTAYRDAPQQYRKPDELYEVYAPPQFPPPKKEEKQEVGSPMGLRRIPKEAYMEPVVKGQIDNTKHFNPQKLPIPIDEEEARLAKKQAAYKLFEKAQYMPPPITKTIFERPLAPSKKAPVEEKVEEQVQRRSRNPEIKVVPSARSQSPPKPGKQSETKKIVSEWVYDCDATVGNVQIRSKGNYENIDDTVPTPPRKASVIQEIKKSEISPTQDSVSPHQPIEKLPPALAFARQPWEITVRKEYFVPGEKLEDSMEIDLIFSQIINDCKNPNPYRIRPYEREVVNQILYDNRIPKNSLDRPYEISMDCKLQIINTARRWPLYFSRLYSIVEERMNERVFMLLGISETGIRLIARNLENVQDPLIIQDHFEFADIADIIVEGTKTITIVTKINIKILMSSIQAASIKHFIEKFLTRKPKQRTHFIAISDYITKEPNLLSFYKGDVIQLVKNPTSKSPATGVWIYGKLSEKFGWVPADYVKSIEESQYAEGQKSPRPRSSNASMLYGTVSRDPRLGMTPLMSAVG